MNHGGYKDLLAAEALHSLDEADAALLREHLATCDECRRESIEWRAAAALLALSVEEIAPPETLRASILASIKQTNDKTHSNAQARGSEATGKVIPLRSLNNARDEKVSASKSSLWKSAIAASIVVAALIIAFTVFRQRDNNARREDQARLLNRNNEKQAESNQSSPRNDETTTENVPSSNNDTPTPPDTNRLPTRSDNNNRQDKKPAQAEQRKPAVAPPINQSQIAEAPTVESAPTELPVTEATASGTNARTVQLIGTAKAPQAHARMIFDQQAGNIAVSVSDLPPPAAGKTYQLWFIVKGESIPGSVFATGREGRAMIRGQIPVRAREASGFAITLEKSNGANKPSQDKYLLGSFHAS